MMNAEPESDEAEEARLRRLAALRLQAEIFHDGHLSAEKRRARLRLQRIELEAELDDETHEMLLRAGEGGTY